MVCNKITAAAAMTTYEGVQSMQEHQQQQINYILDHTNILNIYTRIHIFFYLFAIRKNNQTNKTCSNNKKSSQQSPTLLGTRP